MALLHSFWRGPALQSCARVTELDARCGVAYWGVALAALIDPFDDPQAAAIRLGRDAIEQARWCLTTLGATASSVPSQALCSLWGQS